MPRRPNEVSAGGVLVRRRDRRWEVALVRAGRYWGLPKGRVEEGESSENAALREIAEECGIDPGALKVRGPLPGSDYVYRRAGRLIFKHVDHFLVEVPEDTGLRPQEAEIDEAEWLDLDAATARASFRDTVTALDAARQLLD